MSIFYKVKRIEIQYAKLRYIHLIFIILYTNSLYKIFLNLFQKINSLLSVLLLFSYKYDYIRLTFHNLYLQNV